jgi:hypothetical protein
MDDKKPTSPQPNASLLELILEIAAAANVKLEEDSQVVYLKQLSSIGLEDLRHAANRTIREWDRPHMMPPISYILERSGQNFEVLAEAAWEEVQYFVYHDWHPDLGYTGNKRLSADLEYAVRQCGGLRAIHDCKTDSFQFKRKEFLNAFSRFKSEDGAQVRIGHNESKRFLEDLGKRLEDGQS